MNGGGTGLQKRNFEILERDGVPFHYETAAIELIQDRTGRVIGVRALTPRRLRRLQRESDRARVRRIRSERGDARALSRAGLGHDPRARRAVQHRRRAAHGDGHRRDAARKLDDVPRVAAGHRYPVVHDAFVARARGQHAIATCIRTASW